MRAVGYVARRRLARHALGFAVASLLLGIGFGVCFASLAAARQTASAYDRILDAAHAPDAAVAHGRSPEASEASLRTVDGIRDLRSYAGYVGSADGIDPVDTRALLASTGVRFPLELPVIREGRLPAPGAAGEAIVNAAAADHAGLQLGDRVDFDLFTSDLERTEPVSVRVVGIGSYPVEAVKDATTALGLFVFPRAFYEAHRDLVVYSVSTVTLKPGFDARRDLAAAITPLGHTVQSARAQEIHAVNEALRPTIIVLVALGLLAFGATAVAAAQVVHRDHDRWTDDGSVLAACGMTRGQVRGVHLTSAGVLALGAGVIAIVTMLLASPVAPLGALHDFDPKQGFRIDLTVAVIGIAAIVVTLALCALAFSLERRRSRRGVSERSDALTRTISRAAAFAGLALALRPNRDRGRVVRTVAATVVTTAVFALCAAFLGSAIKLSSTPARYGFDADLLAVNQFGDQSPADLRNAFDTDREVVAVTGFTTATFLLDGRAVPGVAATSVKGDAMPTLLRGAPARETGDLVVGADTLAALDAKLGDVVHARLSTPGSAERVNAGDAVDLRIVGVATFPPVYQSGLDVARLGTGALVTRETFLRMGGDPANQPEYTAVRLTRGADPRDVIVRNPQGFRDVTRTTTSWFSDAKPAELRQLDVAMPYVGGAVLVAFLVVLAVVAHGLWTLVRRNRRDLAILRALGCTRGQLGEVVAWQSAPFGVAVLVGLPLGVVLGRAAFTRFATSLAVVTDATTQPLLGVGLVLAAIATVVVAVALSIVAVSRGPAAAVALREP